jgi:multidrug efflux pump subunit AcrA (membrane-fusion protein)
MRLRPVAPETPSRGPPHEYFPALPRRAPAIEAQVREAESTLAALQAKTASVALARSERQSGSNKAWTDHEIAVAAAKSDLDAKIAAAEEAAEIDRKAAAARVEMLLKADTDDLLEGISAIDCCDGCSATECMVAPGVGRCCHPRKGGLPHEYHTDTALRRIQGVARTELAALERGDYDDDGEEAA